MPISLIGLAPASLICGKDPTSSASKGCWFDMLTTGCVSDFCCQGADPANGREGPFGEVLPGFWGQGLVELNEHLSGSKHHDFGYSKGFPITPWDSALWGITLFSSLFQMKPDYVSPPFWLRLKGPPTNEWCLSLS